MELIDLIKKLYSMDESESLQAEYSLVHLRRIKLHKIIEQHETGTKDLKELGFKCSAELLIALDGLLISYEAMLLEILGQEGLKTKE